MAYDALEATPLVGLSASDTTTTKPVWTPDQIIAQLSRQGVFWASGQTIAYSFLGSLPAAFRANSDYAGFTPADSNERQFAALAFQQVADVANLKFVEAPDNGQAPSSINQRIVFSQSTSLPSYVWGETGTTYALSNGKLALAGANILISPSAVAQRQWFMGGYNFQATMHEILHALGIPHPGDYNANGTTITYANSAAYFQDSRQYTVMSYFAAAETGANYAVAGISYSGATLLLDDIAVLQSLYGANTATRAGDTVYGFHSNAGAAFDFTVNTHPIYCIWDGSGTDTIDATGYAMAQRIDLNQGAFSDIGGFTSNISIAYGADIENAAGGSGDNVLIGNALANRLTGGAGNDILQGGGGDDRLDGGGGVNTAVYSGASTDYVWRQTPDGWSIIDRRAGSPDGTDTLLNIQLLQFTDRTVSLSGGAGQSLAQAFQNILRYAAASMDDQAFVAALSSQVGTGQLSLSQALDQISAKAIATTTVANLAYAFFTGTTPTQAGLDYLVAPAGANPNSLGSAYYQGFSLENRYINFALNLGLAGEGKAKFAAAYSTLSLTDATTTAYAAIFGTAPTADKVATLLTTVVGAGGQTRADYFTALGGSDLGAKAAVAGWLLAEAAKADTGLYAKSNDALLHDLAFGAGDHVDLVGIYGGTYHAVMT